MLLALAGLLGFLVLSEGAARVVSFFAYGCNPYYLQFGFKSWKTNEGPSEKYAGYFKFPENRTFEFGTPEACNINNHGFRGADFQTDKAPGALRVLCLGGSSTFGYHNRDAGTYPALLQALFDEGVEQGEVEVINCGVPYLDTDNIVAMLENELLDYEPDVVTIYSAFNDASRAIDEDWRQRLQSWLDEHSAAYAGMRKIAARAHIRARGRWMLHAPSIDREYALKHRALHLTRTTANYSRILDQARKNGINVVVITQPIRTPKNIEHAEAAGGYDAEYAAVEAQLEEKGKIPGLDFTLYIHHYLVDGIEKLAREEGATIVDNVRLVDEFPASLLSQVHLSEEANGRLAVQLEAAIRPLLERSVAR